MGETFGMHLMLDGYGCDRSKLESETFVYRCGISGFVLIAESHVSIHTFPATDKVN